MVRIRTAALSLAAAALSALGLGLAAGSAVAHDGGHHGFVFGAHRGHALAGTVQSVDASANTAVVTLGRFNRHVLRNWDHGSSSSGATQVTLDLSGAAIYAATAMQRHCNSPTASTSTTTLAAVQPGDMVSAVLSVDHATARQDLASGTPVPVAKLVDFGSPSAGSAAHRLGDKSANRLRHR